MTKKHYEAIASAIAAERAAAVSQYGHTAHLDALESVADRLANYFATDNPKFDRSRFLEGCGIEPCSHFGATFWDAKDGHEHCHKCGADLGAKSLKSCIAENKKRKAEE